MAAEPQGILTREQILANVKTRAASLTEEERRADAEEAARIQQDIDRAIAHVAARAEAIQRGPRHDEVPVPLVDLVSTPRLSRGRAPRVATNARQRGSRRTAGARSPPDDESEGDGPPSRRLNSRAEINEWLAERKRALDALQRPDMTVIPAEQLRLEERAA
jgi:hypothetical protein